MTVHNLRPGAPYSAVPVALLRLAMAAYAAQRHVA